MAEMPAGYDAWKTRSPDDEYDRYGDEPEEECWHEEFDHIDPVNERVECIRCGHTWYRTAEEIEADRVRELEFERAMRSERRWAWWTFGVKPWWRGLMSKCRWAGYRILNPISPRWALKCLSIDDDIPF